MNQHDIAAVVQCVYRNLTLPRNAAFRQSFIAHLKANSEEMHDFLTDALLCYLKKQTTGRGEIFYIQKMPGAIATITEQLLQKLETKSPPTAQ